MFIIHIHTSAYSDEFEFGVQHIFFCSVTQVRPGTANISITPTVHVQLRLSPLNASTSQLLRSLCN